MTESEWYDHESQPLTVSELRAVLSQLPDDTVVLVGCPDQIDGSSSTHLNAVSAEVRPGRRGGVAELLVSGSAPSGRYQRRRRRRLAVTGLPTDDSDSTAAAILALQEAVEASTRSRGHRGSSSMSLDEHAGSITWTWVHKNVPTEELVDAAARVAEALNPGSWTVRAFDGDEAQRSEGDTQIGDDRAVSPSTR